MITLIGLGISEGDIPARAYRALESADEILARTDTAPSFASLKGFKVRALDSLFASSRTFDTLNKKLAAEVIAAAKRGNVCYCVDGGVSEDAACAIILKKRRDVTVIEGVSKGAHAASLAHIGGGYISVSAYSVEELAPCRAAVVYDIDCDYAAGIVKERLSDLFGDERECSFIRGEEVRKIKIYELDRQRDYSPLCAVAVCEEEFLHRDRYGYDDVERMVKLLRAPGGCPWDRAQTNESIKTSVIEEAYELADAIERGDNDGIEEEAGDVLLQAAFHAVLKEEQGVFSGRDMTTRLVKKLIFRHSHIFGGDKASSESEALGIWDKNKAAEKSQTTFGETLLAVPKNMPACMRAQKVGKRAGKSGMDFTSSVSASERLADEVKELLNALIDRNNEAVFDEAGDVLFAAVNTCRLAGVDCEEALKAATDKFTARFVKCEQIILSEGKSMTDMNELELDWYWLQAKRALKEQG